MIEAQAPPSVNGFTVDVEDWYQVADFDTQIPYPEWDRQESRIVRNTERILAILEESGDVKGTFFFLTWNAERHPELVRRIAAAGHEIASHGHGHRLIYEQTPEEFRADVVRSKRILEDLTGTPVLGYRAPSFSMTRRSLWALDILLEEGFRYDSSVFPIRDLLYGLPGSPRFPHVIRKMGDRQLIEVPMTTLRVLGRNLPLGGGGYLRVFPYRYLWGGMRWLNWREHRPAIFYLHPWELDPDQPRHRTAGRRGFSTHYIGLSRTESRLRRLLADFVFAPVRQLLGLA